MSAVDLIILGFLKRSPASAYDMCQKIEKTKLKKIIKIGSPTIYQNIKKLAHKGFLAGRTAKEGEMPDKTIYSLTDKGEDHFLELMGRFANNPGPMFFSFNSFIKNLPSVDKQTGMGLLKSLKLYFYETKADLDADIVELGSPPFEIKAILRQYQILLNGMITWIEEVIEEYEKMEP